MVRYLIVISMSFICCWNFEYAALATAALPKKNTNFLINSLGHEITLAFSHLGMSYTIPSGGQILREEWLAKAYIPSQATFINTTFTSPFPPALTITLAKSHPYSYVIFIGTLRISDCTVDGAWIFKVSNAQFDNKGYSCDVFRCQRITNIFKESTSFICAEWQEKKSHKDKIISREEVDIKDICNTVERRRSLSSPTTTSPVSTSKIDLSQSAFF